MKRNTFTSFVLILALLISLFSMTLTTSAASPEIALSDATARAGSTAKITLDLDDNPGFISMKLSLEYNDKYFSVKSVTDGGILGDEMHSNRYEDSPYTLFWYNALEEDDITDDGEIAEIVFNVASNTPNGTYPIKVVLEDADVVTADLKEIGDEFDVLSGSIKVTGGTSGSNSNNSNSNNSSNKDPLLTVSNATVARGGTFNVTLELENNPGIIALRTMLDFNDDYFTIEKVEDKGILGDKFFSNVYDESPYTLYWTNPLADEDIEKDGKLVTITFSAKSNTPAGRYTIGISSEKEDILNYDLDELGDDFEFKSGIVTVSSTTVSGPDEDDEPKDDEKPVVDSKDYSLSLVGGKAQISLPTPTVSYGAGRLLSFEASTLSDALSAAAKKYPNNKVTIKAVYSGNMDSDFIVNFPEGYADLLSDVESFTLETPKATMKFDAKAIAEMAVVKDSVQFIFGNEVPEDELKELLVSEYKYYDISSTMKFEDGNVTVTLPYKATSDVIGKHAVVYFYDDEKLESVGSTPTYASETIKFDTSMVVPYVVTVIDLGFEDIDNHWGRDAINFVAARGIFNGTSATEFSPDSQLSRGMLVTVLGRLDQIDVAGFNCMFTDVDKNMYYAPYIEWARRNNIVGGTGDNKFEPDRSINRQEIAVIISRYLEYKGKTLNANSVTYTDAANIDSWAREFVNKVSNAGIITGVGTEFQPKANATRAQAATILKRIIEFMD